MQNAIQNQMQNGLRNHVSQANYFLVGVGIGALVSVFFAPKSGEQTRKFLAQTAKEGNEYAQRKAREMRDRAKDLVDRGKQTVTRQRHTISEAINGGREANRQEMSQAQ